MLLVKDYSFLNLLVYRHCEEGILPDEAIPNYREIASGENQERPRNDVPKPSIDAKNKQVKFG
jgi:hypothetical protein